jgi:hypothetical protein
MFITRSVIAEIVSIGVIRQQCTLNLLVGRAYGES